MLSLHMNYIATITSKRQLTIPAALFKEANLKSNQKVLVRLISTDGVLRVEPMNHRSMPKVNRKIDYWQRKIVTGPYLHME